MLKSQVKIPLLFHSLCIVASLIILTDFMLPGRVVTDDIIELKKERQQYYNAAQNYHYSYRIFTRTNNFSVTEDFAKEIINNKKIEFSISRIFKEINSYKQLNSGNREVYSLRILSGLVIPLMLIIITGLSFKYEKKMTVLIFVIQVLVIVDIVFLIM